MRWLFVLALLAFAGPPALAQPVRAAQGQIVELQVAAPALEGNRLGAPTVQPVSVYLPPSYNSASARHYPTLYMLHGYHDTRDAWLSYLGIKAMLDRDIAAHHIPEIIVVMPHARIAGDVELSLIHI